MPVSLMPSRFRWGQYEPAMGLSEVAFHVGLSAIQYDRLLKSTALSLSWFI